MKRKIIEIDNDKCDGCGQCISACHEGALALVDGKARLVKESFCDGLGACIGDCPRDALHIIERDADGFDSAAVAATSPGGARPAEHSHDHAHALELKHTAAHPHACPGAAMRSLASRKPNAVRAEATSDEPASTSALGHWPVQLMLVPPHAPFLKESDLLVCADCVPFAVADFHTRYLTGRAVVVGCPKLDDLDHYADKLAAIVETARPRRLTVLRMEVPCCRGIAQVAINAALSSGQQFPVEEHVIGIGGGIARQIIRP